MTSLLSPRSTRRRLFQRAARTSSCSAHSGQSLVEVALIVPLFTLLLCYAIDIGYFYLVAASIVSSARNSVLYSIQGFTSVGSAGLPDGGPISSSTSVAALALGDLTTFANSSVNVSVYVCSLAVVTSTHTSRCQSYNSAPVPSSTDTDPENPMFTVNRVDVYYTIAPPIKLGGIIPNGLVPTSFHRYAEMRALN
jgi:Flp pilus assembly protein TadG